MCRFLVGGEGGGITRRSHETARREAGEFMT